MIRFRRIACVLTLVGVTCCRFFLFIVSTKQHVKYESTYISTFVKKNEIFGDNKRAKPRNSPLESSYLCGTIGLNQIALLLHRKS